MATSIKRQYIDLAGVDFKNDESLVNLNRSPDALNIYKDYTTEGNCIQSRPGYRKLAELDTNSIMVYTYIVQIKHLFILVLSYICGTIFLLYQAHKI